MAHSSATELRPTLWRTCRVLANRLRLRLLRELFHHPDQTVSAAASRVDIPLALASSYLRQLNARGLLQARRVGKSVYYRPFPDKSSPAPALLLNALEHTFAIEKQPIEVIFRQVTAFTHPRRLAIILALRDGGLTKQSLRMKTGMSQDALARHLAKLADRRFVVVDEFTCRCANPRGRLARTLLDLARSD